MPKSVRAVAVSLRRVEYSLLFPFVFAATWLECTAPEKRERLAQGALALAMMVAGVSGVLIIRAIYT